MNVVNLNHRVLLWYPPLLAAILYSIYVLSTNFSEPENFSWIFLTKAIVQFYCYLIFISFIDRYLGRKFSEEGPYRLLYVFLLGWLVSLIFGLTFYVLIKQAFIVFDGQNDRIGFHHLLINSLSITVGYVLIFCIYLVVRSYQKQMKSELKNAVFEKAQLRLRYELLFNKLEPHFLFNNLNTLHSLIVEQNPVAEGFIISLSKVMRYNVQSREKASVGIGEEVEVFNHYMRILKERLGEALSFEITKNTPESRQIIPMTLPNLLENIVKHNEISRERPLHIELDIKEEIIELRNTLNLKGNKKSDHAGGLHALSEMYHVKTGYEIEYSTRNEMFTVKIPYVDS